MWSFYSLGEPNYKKIKIIGPISSHLTCNKDWKLNSGYADVMKLVDVPDSKSGVVHPTCRFDSGHRHFFFNPLFTLFGVSPVPGSYLSQNVGYPTFCSAEWPSAFFLHSLIQPFSESHRFPVLTMFSQIVWN